MERRILHNRLVDLAIILLFLLTILVPLFIWMIQQEKTYSEAEKRQLVSWPHLAGFDSIPDYTRAFDTYFQDHFGGREWFIHRYQRELEKRFRTSSSPNVFEGTNGWLFFSGDGILDDLKGQLLFSKEEQRSFWRIVEQKEDWLQQKGVAYIFLVAPNKQSIYPEYLPEYYRKVRASSRLDDLLQNKPLTGISPFLDVRSRLLEGKTIARLYDKTDTHWNYYGAHIAYLAVMDRVQDIFPAFSVRSSFHFAPEWENGQGGDLAVMIGRRTSIVEKRPVVDTADFTTIRKNPGKELASLLSLPQLKPFVSKKKSSSLRVLILQDSFTEKLKPFFSESFGEVLYIWQYYDTSTMQYMDKEKLKRLVDIYQPDLVIEEIVERFLPHFFTLNHQFGE